MTDQDKHIESLMDAKGVNSMGECPTCGYVECCCPLDAILGPNGPHRIGSQGPTPTLADTIQAITMHTQELKELSQECGRTLTVLQAHEYRLRKLTNDLVERMLTGKDKEIR